jgi:Mg-chelatase subunit ChlD
MSNEVLSGRDYVLIVDKSGSMSTPDCHGKSRWMAAKESSEALARKCAEFDPDGIDIYVFANTFKKYPNTTAENVSRIFAENEPNGGTALDLVLKDAFECYLSTKKRPVTILVITDGEPNNKDAVRDLIIATSNKIEKDEEISVSFLQVGMDTAAGTYLKSLDDDLMKAGAKFDIVDTVTFDQMDNMTLTEVLINAIND